MVNHTGDFNYFGWLGLISGQYALVQIVLD